MKTCILSLSALCFVSLCLSPLSAADLTVYSGRSKSLVEPLFQKFEAASGIKLDVRYGNTPELAATILEEGDNSPADVFFAQDAGALGALDAAGKLDQLPESILSVVPPAYRSATHDWVGVSGRARVLAYSKERVKVEELPGSVFELTEVKWKDRIGWAPQNASFQAFVTAMLAMHGKDKTVEWLKAMKANGAKEYPKNGPAVKAVADGEVDVALVNHYYLFGFLKTEGDNFPVANYYFANGDVGSMVNVAGVGILKTSKHRAEAEKFVTFLLSPEAQTYFAKETFEYPLIAGVETDSRLQPVAELKQSEVNLNDLKETEATVEILRSAGVLP